MCLKISWIAGSFLQVDCWLPKTSGYPKMPGKASKARRQHLDHFISQQRPLKSQGCGKSGVKLDYEWYLQRQVAIFHRSGDYYIKWQRHNFWKFWLAAAVRTHTSYDDCHGEQMMYMCTCAFQVQHLFLHEPILNSNSTSKLKHVFSVQFESLKVRKYELNCVKVAIAIFSLIGCKLATSLLVMWLHETMFLFLSCTHFLNSCHRERKSKDETRQRS